MESFPDAVKRMVEVELLSCESKFEGGLSGQGPCQR